MPTYAYACTQCGNRFDAVQSFSDAALTECPACGGPVRKQYGSVGVTFNGSGFYRTDSRASGASTSPGTDTGAGGSSSPSSKSEAKASPASSGSSSGSRRTL